jgi:hypothetical protein
MTRAELVAEYLAMNPRAAGPDQEANLNAWITDLKLAGFLTEQDGDFEKTAAWPIGPSN